MKIFYTPARSRKIKLPISKLPISHKYPSLAAGEVGDEANEQRHDYFFCR
jgi:hypothetical protein